MLNSNQKCTPNKWNLKIDLKSLSEQILNQMIELNRLKHVN